MSEARVWQAMPNPAYRPGSSDPKHQIREPDGWPVALVWQERDLHLAAAAPDLLAACLASQLALRATPEREKDYGHEIGLLRAAIAKATGQ